MSTSMPAWFAAQDRLIRRLRLRQKPPVKAAGLLCSALNRVGWTSVEVVLLTAHMTTYRTDSADPLTAGVGLIKEQDQVALRDNVSGLVWDLGGAIGREALLQQAHANLRVENRPCSTYLLQETVKDLDACRFTDLEKKAVIEAVAALWPDGTTGLEQMRPAAPADWVPSDDQPWVWGRAPGVKDVVEGERLIGRALTMLHEAGVPSQAETTKTVRFTQEGWETRTGLRWTLGALDPLVLPMAWELGGLTVTSWPTPVSRLPENRVSPVDPRIAPTNLEKQETGGLVRALLALHLGASLPSHEAAPRPRLRV